MKAALILATLTVAVCDYELPNGRWNDGPSWGITDPAFKATSCSYDINKPKSNGFRKPSVLDDGSAGYYDGTSGAISYYNFPCANGDHTITQPLPFKQKINLNVLGGLAYNSITIQANNSAFTVGVSLPGQMGGDASHYDNNRGAGDNTSRAGVNTTSRARRSVRNNYYDPASLAFCVTADLPNKFPNAGSSDVADGGTCGGRAPATSGPLHTVNAWGSDTYPVGGIIIPSNGGTEQYNPLVDCSFWDDSIENDMCKYGTRTMDTNQGTFAYNNGYGSQNTFYATPNGESRLGSCVFNGRIAWFNNYEVASTETRKDIMLQISCPEADKLQTNYFIFNMISESSCGRSGFCRGGSSDYSSNGWYILEVICDTRLIGHGSFEGETTAGGSAREDGNASGCLAPLSRINSCDTVAPQSKCVQDITPCTSSLTGVVSANLSASCGTRATGEEQLTCCNEQYAAIQDYLELQLANCTCGERNPGYECPEYNATSGSKKGLLGLLGLLGLIPLLLCCLCLSLLLCCIRRKKTGGDVAFATFDPHAAPTEQCFGTSIPTACQAAPGFVNTVF